MYLPALPDAHSIREGQKRSSGKCRPQEIETERNTLRLA
jgi:hypothetical protein